MSAPDRTMLLDPAHPILSIRRQCGLLGLARSGVYRPARIAPGGSLPAFGSTADLSPIGGSLVLFKLTLTALANRPLELVIRSGAPAREGTVELDV